MSINCYFRKTIWRILSEGTENTVCEVDMTPIEFELSSDKKRLSIIWDNGESQAMSAAQLRMGSQSAQSKRVRIAGLEVPANGDLEIRDIKLIGSYAVNIIFSDGYDRGIYPWKLLYEIGANGEAEAEVCVVKATQETTSRQDMEYYYGDR